MKRILFLLVIACTCLTGGFSFAAHGHYVNGIEGIKAASLPPEGFYYRMYNIHYTADTLKDNNGKNAPGNFNVDVFAVANRFIYSSPIEVLGGNMVFNVVIPLVYTDISYTVNGNRIMDDSRTNLGDIYLEPLLLAWHGERWNAAAGFGMYMPTGYYDAKKPASPGKGFWTFMGSLGGTVYLDAEKTWSASILGRYEVHTRQKDTRITPGNDFHFEWGVGKTIDVFTVGVAGYCSWQTTDDTGKNSGDGRERIMGIGPEVGFVVPDWGLQVSLRSIWEFENKNTPQGVTNALVLTKAF